MYNTKINIMEKSEVFFQFSLELFILSWFSLLQGPLQGAPQTQVTER